MVEDFFLCKVRGFDSGYIIGGFFGYVIMSQFCGEFGQKGLLHLVWSYKFTSGQCLFFWFSSGSRIGSFSSSFCHTLERSTAGASLIHGCFFHSFSLLSFGKTTCPLHALDFFLFINTYSSFILKISKLNYTLLQRRKLK